MQTTAESAISLIPPGFWDKKPAEGDRANRPPSVSWLRSPFFPGRFLCKLCSAPVSAQNMIDRGICTVCAEKMHIIQQMAPAILSDGVIPKANRFNDVLQRLKEVASPATIGMSEALLEKSGGADKLGEMLWEDIKSVRGDNLPPELKMFHVTDHKTLKGYHQLLHSLMKERDTMIEGAADPLNSMDEQDLMLVVAEAAKTRVCLDDDFRREMMAVIMEADPKLVESFYLGSFGIATVMETPVHVG